MCRHHLNGDGVFTIDAASPTNTTVAGTIVNGTFNGGPGNLSLQLTLASTSPITINLVNARVKATSISAMGMTATIGGLLLPDEINTNIVPVIYSQLTPVLETDCGLEADRVLPDCGCAKTSAGAGLLSIADRSPKDCKLSLEELQLVLEAQLAPDLCSKPSCANPDGFSVGLKVTTVKASFPGLQ
jgi:hypothetical protein